MQNSVSALHVCQGYALKVKLTYIPSLSRKLWLSTAVSWVVGRGVCAANISHPVSAAISIWGVVLCFLSIRFSMFTLNAVTERWSCFLLLTFDFMVVARNDQRLGQRYLELIMEPP